MVTVHREPVHTSSDQKMGFKLISQTKKLINITFPITNVDTAVGLPEQRR